MIKNLLDADENPPAGTKVIIEETVVETPEIERDAALREPSVEMRNIPEAAQKYQTVHNPAEISDTSADTNNFQPDFQIASDTVKPANERFVPFENAGFEPESQSETARKSGLAYAAGITLFASVVFMMVIGWGADLLFGTKPWGIVGGIVLGALVGFVQFFRLTSRILKNKD